MGESDEFDRFEVDVFATMKKKGRKEIWDRQMNEYQKARFESEKGKEFQKILDKKAVTVITPQEAVLIRKSLGHRILGSRFVNTLDASPEHDGGIKTKSRWCVLGDQDPDLLHLAAGNETSSPTISMGGRNVTLQLGASKKFGLWIGDVDGAFLNSDLLSVSAPDRIAKGGLYCELPRGGIPGVPGGSLVRLDRSVYGLGDAPMLWWKKVQRTMLEGGWLPSALDPCLFRLYGETGELVGLACWHVDDVLCVGAVGDKVFEAAVKSLRKALPFRKWCQDQGEFCGLEIERDPGTGKIYVGQEKASLALKPMPKTNAGPEEALNLMEVGNLRSCNGSVGWIAAQSRPDLCVQTSLAQQGVPNATGRHHSLAQQSVRRARQFADLRLCFQPIELSDLGVCVHSDAAFDRDDAGKPQYGFILGFCQKHLNNNKRSLWSPGMWKSSRVKRACSSTLAAEGQAALDGARHTEWLTSLLCESLYWDFDLEEREDFVQLHTVAAITDCKSLYDHCTKMGGAATLADKSGALDVVTLRETLARIGLPLRWAPTQVQLADGLTKSDADAIDYLRATLREGVYELADEEATMSRRAQEKQRRVVRGEERKLRASQPSTGSQGGPRDYWLPPDSKHYLGKVIRNALVSQEPVKIRIHQVPRSEVLNWDDVAGFPKHQLSPHRLTVMRQVLSDVDGKRKLGPLVLRWDRWGDSPKVEENKWVGATVILTDPGE